MKRLTVFPVVAAGSIALAAALAPTGALAQSLTEQFVGAWTLVQADSVRPDGSRVAVFGANPKGIMTFTNDGHFALVQMNADLPRLAGGGSRDKGTPEENKAIVEGSIAYFGTYSVNEADKTMSLKLDGSTYANLLGAGEQKRTIGSLTPDELKFTNPRTPSGATLEVGGERAR